jgi:hypothetical protein
MFGERGTSVVQISKLEYIDKLTPFGLALLQKLPVVQLLKNIPTFYGTKKLVIVLTRALNLTLCSLQSPL